MQWIPVFLEAFDLAIKLEPKVEAIVIAFKNTISHLFHAGVIDKATQDLLHAHLDAVALAFVNGEPPPAWTVEPDPV
jgi:hypothetical protein